MPISTFFKYYTESTGTLCIPLTFQEFSTSSEDEDAIGAFGELSAWKDNLTNVTNAVIIITEILLPDFALFPGME